MGCPGLVDVETFADTLTAGEYQTAPVNPLVKFESKSNSCGFMTQLIMPVSDSQHLFLLL